MPRYAAAERSNSVILSLSKDPEQRTVRAQAEGAVKPRYGAAERFNSVMVSGCPQLSS